MFYRVTNTIKKIFIMEIQDILKDHPMFYNVTVANKFRELEREKKQIIVKAASSTKQKLGLNNFLGTISSHTALASFKGVRGDALEWVRDDVKNINKLVPAGFYIVVMDDIDKFHIESYLKFSEYIQIEYIQNNTQIAFLAHKSLNNGTEIISDYKALKLVRGEHYTIDYTDGKITFLIDTNDYQDLKISYQYKGETRGIYKVESYNINNEALPGVVLAFGDRLRKGDMQLIEVGTKREDTAQAYGGLWQMSLDITVLAQDTDTLEKLADFVVDNLWANKREEDLVDRGIVITDLGLAGESEEFELDTPDEYNFTTTLSLSLQVEWEVHRPLLGRVEKIFIHKPVDTGLYTDEELAKYQKPISEEDLKFLGIIKGEGSGHFVGLTPIVNPENIIIRPSNF